ncbi:MAG: DNA polymerase III subunit delta [Chloroflexi bacterium HGW-Chloroflexi-8]|jgi:DNA polymerase-3 subunit delta|nr:MAG: DNA polymerase III subunit delta [Chloroflexi bacterium HGW-Chloroflexi-8]
MFSASAPSEKKPSLYIFYGDDGYGMGKAVQTQIEKLGDPAVAEMNITRLSGNIRAEELRNAAYALPFLTERRLVVVSSALTLLKSAKNKENLISIFENLPETTGLVLLVETEIDRKDWKDFRKDHWLRSWANSQPANRVFTKEFTTPNQFQMRQWIIEETHRQKGQIVPAAANELANLTGSNPQLASQEIIKLLTYVNFSRAIEFDDVKELVADVAPTNIFDMVDALAEGRTQDAMTLVHGILDERPDELFGMVIRQFRLLLLARVLMDQGVKSDKIAAELKIHPYVATKLEKQAQRFSAIQLEKIYPRLLKIDENLKTSQMDLVLAMDLFVSEMSNN